MTLSGVREFISSNVRRHPRLRKFLISIVEGYIEYKKTVYGLCVRPLHFLRHVRKSTVIVVPGFLGFRGGVFNPGTIANGDGVLLLAKGQVCPWWKARGAMRHLFMAGAPVLMKLDSEFRLCEGNIISDLQGFPVDKSYAIEDFRLFEWGEQIIVNHGLTYLNDDSSNVEQGTVLPCLSILNAKLFSLTLCGFIQVDFPVCKVEKNWMFASSTGQLYLFYSINPYRVLRMEEYSSLSFITVINHVGFSKLSDPGGFGTFVSFSTNPIDFDEQHWLMIIHQIEPRYFGRCYHHWAVLIDKYSLLPCKITSKAIFSGMGARGRNPGIRYLTSVIRKGDKLIFFNGEGDVYTTMVEMAVSVIECLWIDVE